MRIHTKTSSSTFAITGQVHPQLIGTLVALGTIGAVVLSALAWQSHDIACHATLVILVAILFWFMSLGFNARNLSAIKNFIIIAILTALFHFFGFLAYYNLDRLWRIWIILAVLLAAAVIAGGVAHLVALHPRLKTVATLTAFGFIATRATGASQLLIELWVSAFNLTSNEIVVPFGFRFIVAVFIFSCFSIFALIMASALGWAEYFGMSSKQQFARIPFISIWTGCVLIATLSGFLITMSQSEKAVSDWMNSLDSGKTPPITSGFLFRACVTGVEPSDPTTEIARTIGPAVFVQGQGDRLWQWDPRATRSWSSVTPVEAKPSQIIRVPDGETTCYPPPPGGGLHRLN